MKSNREIRKQAWELSRGKWFWRIFSVGLILYLITVMVSATLAIAYREMEIQTWTDFMGAKLQALQSGLSGYSVPSTRIAWQMTYASVFQHFIACVFGAILIFGGAALLLKAVRDDNHGWVSSSFGGFKRPLEVAWLMILMNAKVFLWSLLFLIPGWVAIYRYRQAWYLKCDHPDWSASKCIAESGRMMRGFKFKAFLLDLSYVGWLMLAVLIFGSATAWGAEATISGSVLMSLASGLAGIAAIYLLAFVSVYFLAGRTVFYQELSAQ